MTSDWCFLNISIPSNIYLLFKDSLIHNYIQLNEVQTYLGKVSNKSLSNFPYFPLRFFWKWNMYKDNIFLDKIFKKWIYGQTPTFENSSIYFFGNTTLRNYMIFVSCKSHWNMLNILFRKSLKCSHVQSVPGVIIWCQYCWTLVTTDTIVSSHCIKCRSRSNRHHLSSDWWRTGHVTQCWAVIGWHSVTCCRAGLWLVNDMHDQLLRL